ncbi:MAG: ammonium transporter, partial [Arcobacteraceae bacterium]
MGNEAILYVIDTLYVLFALTLIIFMVPGFAMLEAGIVRTKNVTTVLMTNTMIYAVASMCFLLIGYNIAFFSGLSGFGDSVNDGVSKYAVLLFQIAFVGKVINIMSGGISERTRLIPLTIFTIIMASVLYPMAVNWTWGANMLEGTFLELSMYDLAGSTVIHSTGGWALLAAILIIGTRKGRYT